MSYNRTILVGNLGQDPELKYTPNGTAALTLSLATNKRWKDKEGNKHEQTDWHRVVVFGKTAENCAQYLKKGRQVLVDGELRTRKWKDKDGNDKYTVEVLAGNVQFLSGGTGSREEPPLEDPAAAGGGGGAAPAAPQGDAPAFTEEDIPF